MQHNIGEAGTQSKQKGRAQNRRTG